MIQSKEYLTLQEFCNKHHPTLIASQDQLYPKAYALPQFFTQNLLHPQRVVKVFKGNFALLKAFYYNYMKLALESEQSNQYQQLLKQVFIKNYDHIQQGQLEDKVLSDFQYRKFLKDFIDLAYENIQTGKGQSFEEQAKKLPYIDKVLFKLFKTLVPISLYCMDDDDQEKEGEVEVEGEGSLSESSKSSFIEDFKKQKNKEQQVVYNILNYLCQIFQQGCNIFTFQQDVEDVEDDGNDKSEVSEQDNKTNNNPNLKQKKHKKTKYTKFKYTGVCYKFDVSQEIYLYVESLNEVYLAFIQQNDEQNVNKLQQDSNFVCGEGNSFTSKFVSSSSNQQNKKFLIRTSSSNLHATKGQSDDRQISTVMENIDSEISSNNSEDVVNVVDVDVVNTANSSNTSNFSTSSVLTKQKSLLVRRRKSSNNNNNVNTKIINKFHKFQVKPHAQTPTPTNQLQLQEDADQARMQRSSNTDASQKSNSSLINILENSRMVSGNEHFTGQGVGINSSEFKPYYQNLDTASVIKRRKKEESADGHAMDNKQNITRSNNNSLTADMQQQQQQQQHQVVKSLPVYSASSFSRNSPSPAPVTLNYSSTKSSRESFKPPQTTITQESKQKSSDHLSSFIAKGCFIEKNLKMQKIDQQVKQDDQGITEKTINNVEMCCDIDCQEVSVSDSEEVFSDILTDKLNIQRIQSSQHVSACSSKKSIPAERIGDVNIVQKQKKSKETTQGNPLFNESSDSLMYSTITEGLKNNLTFQEYMSKMGVRVMSSSAQRRSPYQHRITPFPINMRSPVMPNIVPKESNSLNPNDQVKRRPNVSRFKKVKQTPEMELSSIDEQGSIRSNTQSFIEPSFQAVSRKNSISIAQETPNTILQQLQEQEQQSPQHLQHLSNYSHHQSNMASSTLNQQQQLNAFTKSDILILLDEECRQKIRDIRRQHLSKISCVDHRSKYSSSESGNKFINQQ